jgi:hypothetical protein
MPTDLAFYPDGAFDYAILSQTLQTTHAARPGAGGTAAHRAQGLRQLSQFRALAGAAVAAVGRAHAGDAAAAGRLVRDAEHPPSDRRRFPRAGGRMGVKVEDAWFLAGNRAAQRGGANLRAEHAVFLLSR